jgi:hypothetical protein
MTGETYQRSGEDISDLANAKETAELRGEALVWQMLLHQATAQLSNLAAYPHGTLRRSTLDVVPNTCARPRSCCAPSTTSWIPSRARPATCRPGTCSRAWSASSRR